MAQDQEEKPFAETQRSFQPAASAFLPEENGRGRLGRARIGCHDLMAMLRQRTQRWHREIRRAHENQAERHLAMLALTVGTEKGR